MFRVATAGLLLACVAFGADLTGIWTGQLPDRTGAPQDFSFRFSETGGKMYGDNESTPLAAFSRTGDRISFSVTSELNGQITTFLYSGTIQSGEMELTRERIAPKPEVKPGEKPEPKPKLRLKRIA